MDWPPSTLMQAPVSKSARSDARKATISPMGSGQPKRPMGRLRLTNSVTTSGGWVFLEAVPGAAGKIDGAGRNAVDQNIVGRHLKRQVLGESDQPSLTGHVVDGTAVFSPVDG